MNTDEPNYFGQLLAVLRDEELLRVRRRFSRIQNSGIAQVMVQIITDELEEREGIELQRMAEQKR
jgi:hypothetical protein